MAANWGALPGEAWEHIFSFLASKVDRNSISLVSRSWHQLDRRSRRSVFIGNCYAVAPETMVRRFPNARAVAIKGKPHIIGVDLVPADWGGGAEAWVEAMARAWPQLEELQLERMVVSDDCLDLVSRSFKNLKDLSLVSCDGVRTAGLASIAANCRYLKELDLQGNNVEDNCGDWLSYFPESFNSLIFLNIACLEAEMNFSVLERLVLRCTNLKTLILNEVVPLDCFANLLFRAPQLADLGTCRFSYDFHHDLYSKLNLAFGSCKSLKCLWIEDAVPSYLPTIYDVCRGLTSLILSCGDIRCPDIIQLVRRCKNLQKLWVMDSIEDAGLFIVSESCKLLQELRVFPSDPDNAGQPIYVTERGLVSVTAGCPMLHSVVYYCRQMTNAALLAVAKNCPKLICFRMCIIQPRTRDYRTLQPLDTGFAAIVKSCKDLQRLSVSGLLSNAVFKSIGAFADRLERLSVTSAGDTDLGLHYILSGCKSLRKLKIRDCPFGDKSLLDNAAKLETIRSLWMSSCFLSLGACRLLAQKMPQLNVEVIDEKGRQLDSCPDEFRVNKLYVYRTLVGPRSDAPPCVWTIQNDI